MGGLVGLRVGLGGDLLSLSFLAPLREELSVSRPLHRG